MTCLGFHFLWFSKALYIINQASCFASAINNVPGAEELMEYIRFNALTTTKKDDKIKKHTCGDAFPNCHHHSFTDPATK